MFFKFNFYLISQGKHGYMVFYPVLVLKPGFGHLFRQIYGFLGLFNALPRWPLSVLIC